MDTGHIVSGQQEEEVGGRESDGYGSNVETQATRKKMASDRSENARQAGGRRHAAHGHGSRSGTETSSDKKGGNWRKKNPRKNKRNTRRQHA